MAFTNDEQLRLEALRLAQSALTGYTVSTYGSGVSSTEAVVTRAEKYYHFLRSRRPVAGTKEKS